MADEGSDEGQGQDDDAAKGRTVFGIGLPAAVQEAARAAHKSPAKPTPRPAPPVKSAPPIEPPAHRRVDTQGATLQDVRSLTRPAEDKRGEEKRTMVALPSQLVGVMAQAAGRPAPPERMPEAGDGEPRDGVSDATQPDVRVHGVGRDTGERAAISGVEEPLTDSSGPEGFDMSALDRRLSQVRLVAGKAIPGTRYKLLRWLGEGGMGVVYEAEHIDIERRVALKILRAELSTRSDTAQVFRDEARAAARAGSKNIVEIFDFGELPDRRLFFCMELLSGIDLASEIEGEVDFGRMIAILRQTCKGLGAAHRAGIVHRDIKPENIILVQHEGRRDMVKIVDFGVSAMLDAQREEGPIAGTPQYMAPEQIHGGDFDHRLDLYALGCVAYEMLVGHPPFTDENLADVLLAHIKRPPQRPSEIRQDRNIPRALEEVVMRCLEKDPERRYADMADLEAALCEAQIAAGITTEWDDLPLPDVDPERRAALVARMPSAHGEPLPRRRWLLPAVAVGAALITGVVVMAISAPEITAEERARIDDLSREAREAASVGNYVSLPEGGGKSALLAVKELEAVEGSGEKVADERGQELRTEFTNQLLTVGDKFFEQDLTKPLARDYYTWALAFDPDNERAALRSARSRAEVNDYVDRASSGKLSPGEQLSSEVAVAVMQTDPAAQKSRMKKALAKSQAPLSTQAVVMEAVRGAGVELAPADVGVGEGPAAKTDKPQGTGEAPPPETPPETPEVPPVEADEPDTVIDDPVRPRGGRSGKKRGDDDGPPEAAVKRDPVKADELTGQGKAALQSGRRDEAEALFNQAIGYDRRNADALIGLSDIYFDRGSADKAERFAERAVAVAPNNGAYRLKLGDAYYNTLRYRDALTQYEKALELGEGRASQRIQRVKSKLGQ